MKRILVPVDFSDHALAAARLGLAIARYHGATATLLHALDLTGYSPVAPAVWESYNLDRVRSSARELDQLSHRMRETAGPGAHIETMVRSGESSASIVDYAREWEADLVVMGTYGSDGGKRFLLGSVAGRVARNASCPVLIVRADQVAAEPPAQFHTPLVAIDYSRFSVPATRLAAALAAGDSPIELIHIMHWPDDDAASASSIAEALGDARAEELERLQSFATAVDLAPVRVTARAEIGRVADQILDYVTASDTDLVIVGAHGSEDRAAYLGTVADRILRGSPVPVAVIPEAAAD